MQVITVSLLIVKVIEMVFLKQLTIDNREKSDIIETLEKLFPGKVKIKQLEIGDFLFNFAKYAVLIERKNISDFVNSVRNNRLWDQLYRIVKTNEIENLPIRRKILLIDGTFDQYMPDSQFISDRQKDVFYASMIGAIQQILFVYAIPVIFADNKAALRQFFRILVQREEKGKNEALPEAIWTREEVKVSGERDYRVIMLSSIPTIGPNLAKNLLRRYRTIYNIVNASADSLSKVPGIGKKRAMTIYNFFRASGKYTLTTM